LRIAPCFIPEYLVIVEHAAMSQFRSFDYLPRLARIVWKERGSAALLEIPDVTTEVD
jgi:hypothetical protein